MKKRRCGGTGLETRGTDAAQAHLGRRASSTALEWPALTASKQLRAVAAACAPPARPWRGPGKGARASSFEVTFKHLRLDESWTKKEILA
jgi:hypothetical protein